ncbi:MAG: serine/threonine-protein phosphatase [Thermoguttaceae bacterium]|nr:serine/threonine-protein phosphatase [Thermoguttaceae bacterium]MBQ7030308.1 serine/threonine-protein phosphatase [Thermoguttaceae bacterium]
MNDKNEHWLRDSLVVSSRTDVGMRRSNNQDAFAVALAATPRLGKTRGSLFVVADGMGAHAAGELASQMAATLVSQAYLKRTEQTPPEALRDALLDAHFEIRKRGESDEAFRDMGTTCDALALLPEGALVGHVGDSRVYRLRDRTIEQLTFDHSLVWEARRLPNSRPAFQRLANIPKNIITRSLGPTESLVVDVEGPFPLRPGDAFLLCSDGLSGQFEDSEIGQILEVFQPEEATETLVNLANLRGGPDNITVVVARYKAAPDWEAVEREIEKAERTQTKKAPLSTSAWTAAALASASVGAAICGFCGLFGASSGAVGVGATVLVAAFVGLFFWRARERFFATQEDWAAKTWGAGPYVRASAAPNAAFCENVADVCDQLCDAMREQQIFAPDWDGVASARAQAKTAFERGDFAGSLRANASVINYMMSELKKNAPQRR